MKKILLSTILLLSGCNNNHCVRIETMVLHKGELILYDQPYPNRDITQQVCIISE